ncbi:uncharacterized protein LOC111106184 isoform X2 [Crassostrea virginica]
MASFYVSTGGLMCILCGPGAYKVSDCVINMTSANCEKCPKGTFQSTDNQAAYCAPCLGSCVDRYQVVSTPCTSTSNLKCRCKDGFYFKSLSADGLEGHCLQDESKPQSSSAKDFQITKSNVSRCGNSSTSILCKLNRKFPNVTEEHTWERTVLVAVPVFSLVTSILGFMFLILYYTRKPNIIHRKKDFDFNDGANEPLRDEEWRSLILFIATQARIKDHKAFLILLFELSKLEDNVDNIISNHESNHPSSRTEVMYETLQTWRQKLLRKASVGDICEALSRVGCRRRIIRRIREKYKEIVESRVKRPPFRRAMSLTEGLMGEKVGPIQGKSMAELSAYI